MKWQPADVAQLTYLRAKGATADEIAVALSRTRRQVRTKIGQMIRADLLARKFRSVRIAAGRGETFARNIGIQPASLPDYRLLRRKKYGACEAAATVREWEAARAG